jgi:hypothetical protein
MSVVLLPASMCMILFILTVHYKSQSVDGMLSDGTTVKCLGKTCMSILARIKLSVGECV